MEVLEAFQDLRGHPGRFFIREGSLLPNVLLQAAPLGIFEHDFDLLAVVRNIEAVVLNDILVAQPLQYPNLSLQVVDLLQRLLLCLRCDLDHF